MPDKAAQAAAQAAQAAAMQPQPSQNLYNMAAQAPPLLSSVNALPLASGDLTQEQAIQLLHKLSQQGYMDPPFSLASSSTSNTNGAEGMPYMDASGVQQAIISSPHVLERMFINPPPTTGLYSEEKLRSAHLSGREDLVGGSTYGARFDLQTFASQQQHVQHGQHSVHQSADSPSHHQQQYHHSSSSVSGRPLMSFSPFSPDPNARYTSQQIDASELKRRDSYGLAASAHAPAFEHLNDSSSGVARLAVNARPSSGSRYASYHGGGLVPKSGSGSTGTSPVNRTSMPIPISRPSSGQPAVVSTATPHDPFEMHDLNGTLASLDLVEASINGHHAHVHNSIVESRPWGVKSPAESSDSGASVQFQMTSDSVPSV